MMSKEPIKNNDVFTHVKDKDSPKTYETCYHLVIDDHFENLQERVNNLLGKGWQPIGGLTITPAHGGCYTYGQALIRY
jgi:hypothetical protein